MSLLGAIAGVYKTPNRGKKETRVCSYTRIRGVYAWVEWLPTMRCGFGTDSGRQSLAGLTRYLFRMFMRHGHLLPVVRSFGVI